MRFSAVGTDFVKFVTKSAPKKAGGLSPARRPGRSRPKLYRSGLLPTSRVGFPGDQGMIRQD